MEPITLSKRASHMERDQYRIGAKNKPRPAGWARSTELAILDLFAEHPGGRTLDSLDARSSRD